ncbi:protein YIPF5 homolog [Sitodiplosis mosellana]|uniref:protein YIPF5 homolog n=1 Tax=Sitodiplosis mosellana TaxID=263140 RepID=UPI002443AA15|nr:protein YIPF5 homolog [Sitodiplosis mosellana]
MCTTTLSPLCSVLSICFVDVEHSLCRSLNTLCRSLNTYSNWIQMVLEGKSKMADFMESKHNSVSDFQLVVNDCFGFVSGYFNSSTASFKNETQFLDANDNQFFYPSRLSLSPQRNVTFQLSTISEEEEDDEPPLLEELEIYPELIREKAMLMMNPFARDQLANEKFLADTDLSGPMFFCFLFGACLFLAGKVFIFSHVYCLSMVSVLGMYGLLKLMCYGHHEHFVTLKGVASALGYGMLHLVWFSFMGIFMRLNTLNGFIFAVPAVILPTIVSSRILSMMSNQPNNGALVAYPTALIYIMFSFLVTF